MNWLKNWLNYTKKMLSSSKITMDSIDSLSNQNMTKQPERSLRFYDINDLPLKNFDKCLQGEYQYMNVDEFDDEANKIKFMEIYYKYIEEIGGGNEWAYVHKEYADLHIRYLMLNFSKDLICRGIYANSETKKMMDEYDYTLPDGHELAMIDSYLASLQLDIDNISKQMRNITNSQGKDSSLVAILTQINAANKVYLPYNSILLIEFIEAYKLLKEQQKSIKNGRPNK